MLLNEFEPNKMKIATARPWYLSRWWMKVRIIDSIKIGNYWSASAEFYCPWWAKPLDYLYTKIFGYQKLQVIKNDEEV